MKVGLTYDLRSDYLAAGLGDEETAEFDRDDTIEALENALQNLGHETQRIGHIRALATQLVAGQRWDLVFNICEGLAGLAREAQVPALLEAYGIAYTFSDPLVMSLSLDKAMTKSIVRAAGVPVADGFVVTCAADIAQCPLPFPLFAKPVAEGTGKGIDAASIIRDPQQLSDVCRRLLADFHQPVLVERYLPGREFTVGLLGSGDNAEVLGTLEIVLLHDAEPGAYSYVNKERCEELVEYRLVSASGPEVRAAEAWALAAWRTLRCRDAGRVDLRSDRGGRPHFLEVNPLAGLHPQHSDLPMLCTALGWPYQQLIARIVDSAAERIADAEAVARRLERLSGNEVTSGREGQQRDG
jgi:D-alanine-D-alanine ligase